MTTVSGDFSSATKKFDFEIEKLDYPSNVLLNSQTNSTLEFRWNRVADAEVSRFNTSS